MWKMWKSAGHERGQKEKSSSPSYDLPITEKRGSIHRATDSLMGRRVKS